VKPTDAAPDAGEPWSDEDEERWRQSRERAAQGDEPDAIRKLRDDPRITAYDEPGRPTIFVRSDRLLVSTDLDTHGPARKALKEIVVGEVPVFHPRIRAARLTPLDLGFRQFRLRPGLDPREETIRLRREHPDLARSIGPNHVLLPTPGHRYGPADAPQLTEPRRDLCGPEKAGKGVRVAVLDTGADAGDIAANPWLVDRVGTTFAAIADDPYVGGKVISDVVGGHGNFVAGRVVEQAPGVDIDVISVAKTSKPGSKAQAGPAFVEESRIVWAISLALASGHDVVTMSFGGPSIDDLPLFSLEAALVAHRRSDGRQVAFVASAGNDDTSVPYWPAAHDDVVSVGAVDALGVKAPFSNHNPPEPERPWVDCCTSGVHVASSFVWARSQDSGIDFEGWATWSGTSFAAPRVAGRIVAHMTATGLDGFAAGRDLLTSATTTVPDLGVLIS
jgi:subtilisin family serine protease